MKKTRKEKKLERDFREMVKELKTGEKTKLASKKDKKAGIEIFKLYFQAVKAGQADMFITEFEAALKELGIDVDAEKIQIKETC